MRMRAHPRVCGENGLGLGLGGEGLGSSPRVRGKPHGGAPRSLKPRLIPACAGKTRHSLALLSGVGAHPRVCGENLRCGFGQRRAAGSSPRVRGKRQGREVPKR